MVKKTKCSCALCIHDGSAHAKFDVTLSTPRRSMTSASAEPMDLICERTPGFNARQGERWPSCCGRAGSVCYAGGIGRDPHEVSAARRAAR